MIIVFTITAVILAVSICLTCFRIIIGPNSLDRLVSVDMLVAIIIEVICLWCTVHRQYFLTPTIVGLAMISFIGSTTVARYRVNDDEKL